MADTTVAASITCEREGCDVPATHLSGVGNERPHERLCPVHTNERVLASESVPGRAVWFRTLDESEVHLRELSDAEKDADCVEDHCEFCGEFESECVCPEQSACKFCGDSIEQWDGGWLTDAGDSDSVLCPRLGGTGPHEPEPDHGPGCDGPLNCVCGAVQ